MNHTVVSSADVFKTNRLDPAYFLTLARLREKKGEEVSLLEHVKRAVSVDEAQAWLARLPAQQVAQAITSLAVPADRRLKAQDLVARLSASHPHESLSLVLERLDDWRAMARAEVTQAQTREAELTTLAETIKPRRSRRPA